MQKKELKRKENWTKIDIKQLVYTYCDNKNVLEGKFSGSVSASAKAAAWNRIVESVNSVSTVQRTVDEAKKKYADIKSITKKKERGRRQYSAATGGGLQAEPLEDWEEKIVSTLSESVIIGVEGGIDTFQVGPKGDADRTDALNQSNEVCKPSTSSCQIPNEEPTTVEADDTAHDMSIPKEDIHKHKGIQPIKTDTGKKRKAASHVASYESILEIEKAKLKVQQELLDVKKQKLCVLKTQAQQTWEQTETTNKLLQEILQCLKQAPYIPDVLSDSPMFKI